MTNRKLTRREFLHLTGLGAGSLAVGNLLAACQPDTAITPVPIPVNSLSTLSPSEDLEINLRAAVGKVNILSGEQTGVWHYQAELTKGNTAALQILPDSYLGPIIHTRRGQTFRAHFINELDEPTTIHWHGLHIPAEMDGHPRHVIGPGETFDYEFKVLNRSGTYWFHPHPHTRAGAQVYTGMAGLFIIHDEEEGALDLPSGEFDLPIVIQDRLFDAGNQFVYTGNAMIGFLGDTILVNGQTNASFRLLPAPYRLRILNGSNARIYKLAWDDGLPITVIATDGGLLEKPVQYPYVTLAPGQRVELWADFSGYAAGQSLHLVSQQFSAGGSGMGMMGGASTPQGTELTLLAIHIQGDAPANAPVLPPALSNPGFYHPNEALRTRRFETAMQHMTGTINGRTFIMNEVAADETVRLGDLEIWEFSNRSGGGMGMMGSMMDQPHPMHIHGAQFQVVERNTTNAAGGYDTLSAGFVDDGWRDVVLVMPGERVKVLVRFEDYPGLYLYHCHNLEHEDGGMMRNYEVKS